MRTKKRQRSDPFTDLLFNALLGFTFLFLVAIMYMNPEAKSGIIDPKAEYILTVTWPDNNPDDIDVWLEDPDGRLIWFRNPEAGLLHLDRDDRGMVNDTITITGKEVENPLNQEVVENPLNQKEVENPLNQEIVTIRGVIKGEYVVNLHYYASQTNAPVAVSVRLVKVNPALKVIYYDTVLLEQQGDEKTALRFHIQNNGEVVNLGFLPKKLVLTTG